MEGTALALAQKKAQRGRRTIVFIDETGISERPTRVRTWAPVGQTPVLQYSFRCTSLSAIAGITFWRFYFGLFAGAIRSAQLIEFLSALGQQIRGRLLVIWDGLPVHKSPLVRSYVESRGDRFVPETLPAYAPELNPVEYIWAHMKQRELANPSLETIGQVGAYARNCLKSMQPRPRIIAACWKQAELPI